MELALCTIHRPVRRKERRWPTPGTIRGTHHLTFCVGGAQEDYDFHVKTLGLKMVKKTVLFDGEVPIYHLYYGNEVGNASTLLTSFPYRQAGWMGKRGTQQARFLNLSVPADSIGFWADRLKGAGIAVTETERFGTQRLDFEHPCGIPIRDGRRHVHDDRQPYDGGGVSGEHAIRGAHGTTTFIRDLETDGFFLARRQLHAGAHSDGQYHQFEIGTDEGYGRMLEMNEERDLDRAAGPSARARSTTTRSTSSTARTRVVRKHSRRPRLHRRLRGQGPRLLLLRVLRTPGGALRARVGRTSRASHRRAAGAARHVDPDPAALGAPPSGDLPAREDRDGRDGGRLTGEARVAAVLLHGRDQDAA